MSIEINVTLNGAQNLSEYMKKADFDPDGNFIPESAEKLDDGTNEVTAAQAKDAVDKAHVAATAGAGISVAGQVITNSDRGSTAVSAHEAAVDPHTQYQKESEKGQANGYASLGSDSKIPAEQLPDVTITDTFVVASEVAMLALSAQLGDVAVRTDLNKSFILKTAGATVLANWQELLTPTISVLSVAGKTGIVTLGISDLTDAGNLAEYAAVNPTAQALAYLGGGDLELVSENSVNGTKRILLSSYERAVQPTHYGEVMRADWKALDAKVAIAFRDAVTNPGSPVSKGWLLAHDYLQYTDAAYSKTFLDAAVNASTDRITVTAHGFTNGQQVKLWSEGTLPTGIAHLRSYFVKVIDADTLELYRQSGLTTLINITAASGGGTHHIDNVTLGNNPHKHVSFEVTDATGALQTRMEFPFDLNTTWIRIASAHLVVNDGKLYITGADQTANKELRFGLDETDVYTRWSLRQDNTAESGSNVGSDFRIVSFTDAGAALATTLFIKRSNGRIGIGNSAPTEMLDVTGNIQAKSAISTSVLIDRGAAATYQANLTFATLGTAKWVLRLNNDGTDHLLFRDSGNGRTMLQLNTDNKIGFFAATPVVKQTVSGAKGSNAALGSLLTALANFGLITDSTTA